MSLITEICRLTTTPRLSITCTKPTPSEDEASVDLIKRDIQELSLVRNSAASKSNNTIQSDNDTSSLITLCEDKQVTCCMPEPWLA